MLGEFELIAAIRERLSRAGAPERSRALVLGSGDDAAVSVHEGATATTVDALVEGVHFEIPPFEPAGVGRKALAVALSDLAAMAATPAEAYVQLGVPESRTDAELLELADGLAAVAAEHGVAIAGGDVTRAPALLVAVTAVGEAPEAASLVTRGGARPGDLVAVTGELGGAAAGLMLLQRPELAEGLAPEVAEALRARQLEPVPRIAAGLALGASGATALIDLSDGLGADAGHVAEASRVALSIEIERLPIAPGVVEVASAAGADPLELATAGGEDYELLAAIPPERIDEATSRVAATGLELSVVGVVEAGADVELKDQRGEARSPSGFDQLRSRRAPPAPA